MHGERILEEVKRGKTGYGWLFERDGHMRGNMDIINQINEDIKNHEKFVIPDRFTVSALFQRYGAENANGRIYPEAILKREVEKYIEERVNRNCAIAALDHPSCQLAGTGLLTKSGWKFIEDVKEGEDILTLTTDKKIEIHPVIKKIEQEYEGKLIHIKNRSIDLKVTPNHKFPVFNKDRKFVGFYTAQELMDGSFKGSGGAYLLKTGEWVGRNDEYFTIPALEKAVDGKMFHKRYNEKYSKDLVIPMDIWAKFLGIYLSEGCTNHVDKISIYQVKEDVCNDIRDMLDEFPLDYHEYDGEGCRKEFAIYDMRLCKYLEQFGICYNKFVPVDFKQQSKETLRTFYEWFVMGDGRGRGTDSKNYYTDDVFSTSKQLVMDLNEIQLKIGFCGSYHKENRQYDRLIEGRLIEGKNCSNMYFTYRSITKGISIDKLSFEEEEYKGMVYCVEVENHNFYTMDWFGHCVWSGNSSTLSLHDVTHKITKLEWEGCNLVGEMDLHLSPGYRRYGVCSTSGDLAANLILDNILIGVSSRGVGSVEEKMGKLIVGDDFELIAFDIVGEPSTHNAYIKMNRDELRQYYESDETKIGKEVISEKINRLKNILT